jgi:two-component system, NtrC family, response regulator AlgB
MRVLIVDDEKTVRLSVAASLETLRHEVFMARDRVSALNVLRNREAPIEAVFLDVRLSDENGLDLLGEILVEFTQLPVIIFTAYASIDTAVEAMRRGAFDYIPKPCTPDQIRRSLGRVERVRQLDNLGANATDLTAELPDLDLTTGSTSSEMQEALNIAYKAALSDATVLLIGEGGTGKNALAHAIHRRGPRASRPFLAVGCQTHSDEVLEMELFGHGENVGGGNPKAARGKVAAAEGGTLYLEEACSLSAELQMKMLRLIQEHCYERAGEAASHRANIRIIAATSQDLWNAVENGTFRKDLYYRLSVIPITLPPLRSRIGDIDSLIEAYLSHFTQQYGRPNKYLTPAAIRKLRRYEWPGNLRELCNVIERAIILSNGKDIDVADLPSAVRFASDGHTVRKSTLEEVQNEHIRHVLANTGSLQEASSILGIDPATLYRKRKKLGV